MFPVCLLRIGSCALHASDVIILDGNPPQTNPQRMLTQSEHTDKVERRAAVPGGIYVTVTFSTVIKTTVFMKNMGDFQAFNGVYAEFFREPFPARSCVQVAALPKDALVEIEAVAARRE